MERSDTIGLSVAAAGHVLLLAALSLGLFKAPKAPVTHQPTIDVSLVDAVALQSATRSPAAPTTAQAPETGPVEDAAPAPAPEPEPKPVAKPEPAPPPPPTPRAQPKPEPKPEPKPVPKPVPKPAPKPKPVTEKPAPEKAPPPKAKPAAAAAPEPKKTPPAKPAPKPSATRSEATGKAPSKTDAKTNARPAASSATKETAKATAGAGKAEKPRGSRLGPNFLSGIADDTPNPPAKGAAAPLGAAEARALNAEITRQLKPYWRGPTGADVDQLVTVLTWRLNRDGTIASGPTVVSQSGKTDTNRPQQQLHIEAAIRAVRAAAPFTLPPQFYDNWKYVEEFRFDKRL